MMLVTCFFLTNPWIAHFKLLITAMKGVKYSTDIASVYTAEIRTNLLVVENSRKRLLKKKRALFCTDRNIRDRHWLNSLSSNFSVKKNK